MDVSHLLDGLNEHQRQVVSAAPCSKLVLAGAGSGKTRVLVHRIAWLMQVEQLSPHAILAVTFTNKAAAEMRGRVERLLGSNVRSMWIGTFHGLAHRLLRAHYRDAKLPEGFQILDAEDQLRMVKRVIRAMNLDEKQWPPRQACWYINGQKDEGLRPEHIDHFNDPQARVQLDIYRAYQQACDLAGLVDFAELLLRAHELLRDNEHLLRHYQQRFGNILVDEFQDTNGIQYAWLRLLAGSQGNLMIVGDDDQSIYGWRGAKVENIQQFLQDFPTADTVRLEQNYRSTATILNAANALISNNAGRLGKDLWTDGKEGAPISVYAAFNELDEARFIAGQIKQWLDDGNALNDAAILYRSNAQSRVLEEALLQAQLPYRIYGGQRFFERQEIKDALAYLRLISNRDDDAAFERVVNTPTRGIGDRTLGILRSHARDEGSTLWQAAQSLLAKTGLAGRAAKAVEGFLALLQQLDDTVDDLPLHSQTERVIHGSGLMAMYQAEKGEKAETRVENLKELVSATRGFVPPEDAESMLPLDAFLSHAALEAGDSQADEFDDAVQLMTLHSAKGLEFPLVFMGGVEEGMFPSQMSSEEPGRLEEERRLCYVGMTRAMQQLYICHAESRRIYGRENYQRPSRFLREIPEKYQQQIRIRSQVVSAPVQQPNRFSQAPAQFAESGLHLGQRVAHPKFGDGTVLNYEGVGEQSRVQVNFDDAGSKWLVVAYARLQGL
ncbi:DNA helicase II [Corallincola luteus]|uniref:DNA 3'-5' helicase n=1 Tax=Corallincola luteus TaxID=1775177 RepID=A0ABY2AM40_9GAMM|nr:DNA helicase II [Corallincola luteus]TCI02623.1 DNA helicase II [Corallincola luteus]